MYSACPTSAYFIKNKIPCFLSYLLVGISKLLEPNTAFKKDIDNCDCSISPKQLSCPDSPSTSPQTHRHAPFKMFGVLGSATFAPSLLKLLA